MIRTKHHKYLVYLVALCCVLSVNVRDNDDMTITYQNYHDNYENEKKKLIRNNYNKKKPQLNLFEINVCVSKLKCK